MIKFICDQVGCGEEIKQEDGGGTFTIMTKVSSFDATSKQIVPQLKQEELQLCSKHAQEVLDFIKKEKEKVEENKEIF